MPEKNIRSKRFLTIKYKLLEKDIKQKQVAEELNISEAFLSLVISGKRNSREFDKWAKENLGID